MYVVLQPFFVTLVIPSIESVKSDGFFVHTLGTFIFSKHFKRVVHSIISNIVYIGAIVRLFGYNLSPPKLSQDSKWCIKVNSLNTRERKYNLYVALHDEFFGDKTVKHPLEIFLSQFKENLSPSPFCSPIVHIRPVQHVIISLKVFLLSRACNSRVPEPFTKWMRIHH